MKLETICKDLDLSLEKFRGDELSVYSPVDGSLLMELCVSTAEECSEKIEEAQKAFRLWREVPAPKRGEVIRLLGEELRKNKEALAQLVTLECGKILEEGRGEVQEMIDICDFAVGLSRQLYGLTIASERNHHTMQENWHPLGVVAVISAFNFPVAVWAWNFALAVVCGDSVIWKPSEKTPLCALVCQQLFERTVASLDFVPPHLSQVVVGDRSVGEVLVQDPKVALVSATGSTQMGRTIAPIVANRFGKVLLELGGNNAVIVSKQADLGLALPSILFGAVGTAGQRCTTTRRLFVQREVYPELIAQLKQAYQTIGNNKVGNPFEKSTLVGPLVDASSFNFMQKALRQAQEEGGTLLGGERVLEDIYPDAYYVTPALVEIYEQVEIVQEETFAPILYVMPYDDLFDAIEKNNAVKQGLSSAIFTTDLREAEWFKQHSDCGITNVNIGTSGAEIGGAFGGEKETGGGRESGSDSWKNYMRRQTSTSFYGFQAPQLAQGIQFDLKKS